jgi:hypothetical protein
MKDFIAEYYNEEEYDGFTFSLNKKDQLEIISFRYDSIEAHKPKALGFKYHILIYQEPLYRQYTNVELYEAVLGDPINYVEPFIMDNWSGILCKYSDSSLEPMKKVYESMLGDI